MPHFRYIGSNLRREPVAQLTSMPAHVYRSATIADSPARFQVVADEGVPAFLQ